MKKTQPAKEYGTSTKTAFTAIRELIVQGRLAPGSWTVESDLCARLGLSRTPVRAALQWLQYEGYVVSHGTGAKSRMMVTPLTMRDANELYMIVGHIEGIAGRLTSLLPPKSRNPVVATLRKLNSQLMRAASSQHPKPGHFVDVDTAFHDRIVEAGSGSRLLAIYNAIKPQTERYWRLYSTSITDGLTESCEEHERIIEAIANGDADSTERSLRMNWEKGAERLAKAIAAFGERGSW